MKHKDGVDIFFPKNRAAWRTWLEQNYAEKKSVWLGYEKFDSGKRNVTYSEAVEEALCFGWIDSKPNKLDDRKTLQYFARRNPRSSWSKLNKERVARLEDQNLMHESGLNAIRAARENGAWNALDEVENLIIPEDLLGALKKRKQAYAYYEAFPRSAKRVILEWINSAKRPETRRKRIRETVLLASKNIRANSYTRLKSSG